MNGLRGGHGVPTLVGMRRPAAALLAVVALAILAAGVGLPASATQNTPPLQNSCRSGYTYGEHTFGSFVIEGCSQPLATSERPNQRSFRGTLEVNGLRVEATSGDDDYRAWTDSTMERDGFRYVLSSVAHLRRNATTKLVAVADVLGSERRFVLYSGNIHLQAANGAYRHLGVDQPSGTVDIPVNGAAALLGLRVRSTIEDAVLQGDTMALPLSLSLGSGAPALLRDVSGDATVTLVGGQGMRVDDLEFHVGRFELPGIGGMRNFRVSYLENSDRWRGQVRVEMGELFGGVDFEFEVEVAASTGVPTYIRLAVDDMNFPIGQSGIFLQGARGEFGMDPLLIGAGLTATAGPRIAGAALIEMGGDLELLFEPNFRLDASGTARVLPTGPSSQLGTGRISFVYDADGYVSVSHRQHYQALVLGVGPSADINGSGSYATDRNRFNVQADATGRLELGLLGGFDVVRLGAVVSSEGWGTCGSLAPPPWGFLTGGIGQNWSSGMRVLTGCDLSRFSAPLGGSGLSRSATSRSFVVAPGTNTALVAVTAAGPAPRFRLTGPATSVVVTPTRGRADPSGAPRVAWLGSAASSTSYVFLKLPRAGRYVVTPLSGSPALSSLRLARTAAPVRAVAAVTRPAGAAPGVRRLVVKVRSGLDRGERLLVRLVGRTGSVPMGVVRPGASGLVTTFTERGVGPRRIVGQVIRDGVPLPGRAVTIGRYTASLPPSPAGLVVRRVGSTAAVRITPVPVKGAERPDGWAYAVSAAGRYTLLRGTLTGAVSVRVPRASQVVVAVRPVVDGRVLRVPPRVVTYRRV